jgi:hypothetical protein
MSKLRAESFSVSLDGFGAGPNQSLENPLGVEGTALHGWAFATQTFRSRVLGTAGGETWPDDRWKGWWGENPPYHSMWPPMWS